jgi:predicted nucleotidyltransferase
MLTKETILDTIKVHMPYFRESLGVRSIGLFGSYANGYMKETSDVDLLIDMPADFSNLCAVWNLLEQEFNTKVDLVRRGSHLRSSFLNAIEKEIIYA